MEQPTIQQIEEAKEYIKNRIDAEASMKGNLHRLLRVAASRLAELAKEHGLTVRQTVSSASPAIQHRIRTIMDWLYMNIEDCVNTLAVSEHKDDKDLLIAYIKRKQYGKTFSERLSEYVNGFVYGTESGRSPVGALSLLTSYAVTEGWMRWWGLRGERSGANGFLSFRGSSYPCPLCNSKVGYHPISEYVGAWHPYCKCYFIFI